MSALSNDTALFRVCSVPLEAVFVTGNPDLFSVCAALDGAEAEIRCRAEAAAQAIHEIIREHPLPRADSKNLGRLVSRLQRRVALRCRDHRTVDALLCPRNGWLAAEVRAVEQEQCATAEQERRARDMVADEPQRAAIALWAWYRENPVMMALLAHRDPEFLQRCVAHGQAQNYWMGKKGRRRLAYLRDITARAAFRTIPRDWHAYVTLLPAADTPRPPGRASEFAMVRTENIHAVRREIARKWPEECDSIRLGLAPIRWSDPDKILFCVTDLDNPTQVSEVALKRTEYLERLVDALAFRALDYPKLVATVGPGMAPEDREILDGFVGHLIKLGVLLAARDPDIAVTPWRAAMHEPTCVSPSARRASAGYLDVYGRGDGSFSRARTLRLQDSFRLLGRLTLLVEMANDVALPPTPTGASELSLLEIVRDRLLAPEGDATTATVDPAAHGNTADWPVPADVDTAYGRFIHLLRPKVAVARTMLISDAELNAAGAPDWFWRWPADVIVRLAHENAEYVGVFDEAFAAGSMNSRFAAGVRALGLAMPQHEMYLRFLRAVEGRIGERFLELLFPPLSDGAANAVCRPAYVRDWTGDPDCRTYYGSPNGALHYVDLLDLTIRPTPRGNRVVHDDRIVFPMYHATRLPIAPWDVLVDVLLNAAPFQMRWSPRKLRRLLDAFPDMRFAPRLELEGGLVACCAQWRLSGEIDWQPSDSSWTRVRALGRLKRRLGLPRMVFLSAAPGHRPVLCDLESLCGLQAVEALLVSADPIAIEMLPGVGETIIQNPSNAGSESYASSTMLRFPMDTTPEAFAEQVAPDLL